MEKIIYQTKLLFPDILWQRPVNFYKSKAGRILVIGGSRGTAKAALLTADAAFKSGTGIVTIGFPEELNKIFFEILPKDMSLELPQTPSGSISRVAKNVIMEQVKSTDVVVIGPGISTNTETVQLIWELIKEISKPMIIVSDGISALLYGIEAIKNRLGIKGLENYLKNISADLTIVTIPGEATRLLKAMGIGKKLTNMNYIENHKIEIANLLYDYLSARIILIGVNTVIKDNKYIVEDKITNSDFTTANVLAGIVASFIGQNTNLHSEAAVTAVYLHSLSISFAKKYLDKKIISERDILKYLSQAIKESEFIHED